MKKFAIAVCTIVFLAFVGYQAYYSLGLYWNLQGDVLPDVWIDTEGKEFRIRQADGSFAPFEIRGVDMGSGRPGAWTADYAIDKETYLRWFGCIQDMGANTVRIYTIHHQDFYDAFYEYNAQREKEGKEPLYLINGVWVNDYVQNSHASAYDSEFLDVFLNDCRKLVDVIHGKVNLNLGYQGVGSGHYRHDVSRWVLGYILGVEWENGLVAYTNQVNEDRNSYAGEYLYTAEGASPFEAMLAQVGDKMIEYETNRYHQQRLIAFSNWPNTDPFSYPFIVAYSHNKISCVDVEHILSSGAYLSGMFASYHVYPYYPDFVNITLDAQEISEEDILLHYGNLDKAVLEYRVSKLDAPEIFDFMQDADLYDDRSRINTYRAYLKALVCYHTIPVVISEYGIPTGRGMSREDENTGRNQGCMNEQEQGQALIECYQDIISAGCAGSCLAFWQDEWCKRTWNTFYAIDRDKNAYWSDFQTNGQFFGVLTFDPGEEKSVCYVDGDVSEWGEEDLVASCADVELSMKYDEKFVYFMIRKDHFDMDRDVLYIPIDTNPKVGSTYCLEKDVSFARAADFLMVISGKEESRLLVQERCEALMSTYHKEFYAVNPYYEENTPALHSPIFKNINMALNTVVLLPQLPEEEAVPEGVSYETGLLRYGNANPSSPDFDSLADFIAAGDYVEIRIPWQLLNFSNPSEMMIHDDYYACYGVENLQIDGLYVGAASADNASYRIPMAYMPLEGWGKRVTYHERFKQSYYMLKDYWTSLDESGR